ncbi:putative malate permease [Scheffersomyces xylosifermentans]|uniref:putative malate permease n=1 Tax=Scheffersomyces xylosifermentans TaxID=1304137 RepID=UPI00315D7A2C
MANMDKIDKEIALAAEDDSSSSSTKTEVLKPFATRLKEMLFREFIEKFVPAYFGCILGVGISANILYNFPYPSHWLRICGLIMFGITVVFFLVCTVSCIIGCCYYPERIAMYHIHPMHSVFMAVYVMGFITIINFIHYLVGESHSIFVWSLWWIAVFMSVYNACIIFFFTFISKFIKPTTIEHMHSIAILPVVTLAVVSSSGHLLTNYLHSVDHKVITEVISFICWSICVVMGAAFSPIYFARLLLHKLPSTPLILTNLLPIGLFGQCSYSIFLFGVNMSNLIPDRMVGTSILVSCGLFATVLAAFGYFMTFLGTASILSKVKPFAKNPNPEFTTKHGFLIWHKGFWAMNFPLGTMCLASGEIGKGVIGNYPLLFFKILACIYAVVLFLITLGNLLGVALYIKECTKELFTKYDKNSSSIV